MNNMVENQKESAKPKEQFGKASIWLNRGIACLLFFAAGMKAWQLATVPVLGKGLLHSRSNEDFNDLVGNMGCMGNIKMVFLEAFSTILKKIAKFQIFFRTKRLLITFILIEGRKFFGKP